MEFCETTLALVRLRCIQLYQNQGAWPDKPITRKLSRPNHPSDLRFNLDEEHIAPSFLQDDIAVDGGRHILFATAHMLDMLGRSRVWFLDGTFKCVREPFYQLFSVYSFIRSGTTEKQVPLAFAIMSGKRIVDYAAVLRSILRILPVTNVQKVVTDFESSIWQALRDVLPDVQVTGCLFHYTQTIRQLLSLPNLPVEHVNEVFQRIELSAGNNQAILQMMEYIRSYWLQGNVFTPQDWVVYRQNVRTNNDLEGWHHRLNHRAKRANIQFYMLCQLLYEESQTVSINAELIYREDELRTQAPAALRTNQRLHKLWDEYAAGTRTARTLLIAASHLISPNAREAVDARAT
ncbi:uncharacterized protein LOC117106742 [Anneissia japonica]|uniref:uncharacterized protein LOC117106742 n=1 Tax=Anneissia japonica TaxID=1529436 RepID=UPI0014256A0C|nr:uncharacterized protein LOC117106742 [Anneissia japonica]